MKRILFITLLLSTIITYQGFAQSSLWGELAINKRTDLYTAKVATNASLAEKARVAKIRKTVA